MFNPESFLYNRLGKGLNSKPWKLDKRWIHFYCLVHTPTLFSGLLFMEPKKNSGPYPPSHYLADMDKVVETLTLRAMTAGNDGDFDTAFLNMDLALWLSQSLKKKSLEAVLLNNLGLLYTMEGSWDRAMLTFDRSMEIAVEFCLPHDNFLITLKSNISCLFDPKIATPGSQKDN